MAKMALHPLVSYLQRATHVQSRETPPMILAMKLNHTYWRCEWITSWA